MITQKHGKHAYYVSRVEIHWLVEDITIPKHKCHVRHKRSGSKIHTRIKSCAICERVSGSSQLTSIEVYWLVELDTTVKHEIHSSHIFCVPFQLRVEVTAFGKHSSQRCVDQKTG